MSFIENSLCYAGFENPCLYAFMRYHVYDANHSLVVDSFLQTKQEYPNFFGDTVQNIQKIYQKSVFDFANNNNYTVESVKTVTSSTLDKTTLFSSVSILLVTVVLLGTWIYYKAKENRFRQENFELIIPR